MLVTNVLKSILRMFSAYMIVQITVGVQLGVAIAWGYLVTGLPISLLTAILAPLGLILVIGQLPLAITAFANSRADTQITSQ